MLVELEKFRLELEDNTNVPKRSEAAAKERIHLIDSKLQRSEKDLLLVAQRHKKKTGELSLKLDGKSC